MLAFERLFIKVHLVSLFINVKYWFIIDMTFSYLLGDAFGCDKIDPDERLDNS
jgi:hypothetical protein